MFRNNASGTSTKRIKRLGELFIEDDIITQEQLEQALAQQRANGGFLGQILVEQKVINQDTLISYLAKQCHIPHLSLLNYKIGPDALAQVPKELCLKHYLIPVDKMGRILTLAMVDPLDTQALDEIKKHCPGLRIKPVLCSWEHFQVAVKHLYAQEVKRPDNMEDRYAQFGLRPPTSPSNTESSKEPLQQQRQEPDIDKTIYMDTSSPPAQTKTHAAPVKGAADTPPSQVKSDSVDEPGAIQEMAQTMRTSVTAAVKAAQTAAPEQPADMAAIASGTLESIAKNDNSEEQGLASIAQVMLQSLDAEKKSRAEKEEHLAKIAQAALASVRQTAEFIEMHTVAQNRQSDLHTVKPARHDSVAPFSASNSDNAADASEYQEEDEKIREALRSERPLDILTFENFFAGKTNEFTIKLARAVAKQPGSQYNPLFIHGKVGLGKTHLISAIGNANLTASADSSDVKPKRIGYVSASHFARRLTAAISENALEVFRDNYCHWDMLILDDIQFLGGRVEAQEEFFHIFNVFQQEGRQIIIAGDKAPDRLGMLEQRLVSRFASGIVAELIPPEWETRMKILRYLADSEQAAVPDEIMSLVAMRVADDIRKMTGALRKIIAFARLEGDTITVEDAQRILSHLGVNDAA